MSIAKESMQNLLDNQSEINFLKYTDINTAKFVFLLENLWLCSHLKLQFQA